MHPARELPAVITKTVLRNPASMGTVSSLTTLANAGQIAIVQPLLTSVMLQERATKMEAAITQSLPTALPARMATPVLM